MSESTVELVERVRYELDNFVSDSPALTELANRLETAQSMSNGYRIRAHAAEAERDEAQNYAALAAVNAVDRARMPLPSRYWLDAVEKYEAAEKELARLREVVQVCGRHLCDCCRTDIDWKLQMETHNQAVNAVGWIENFDRPGPVTAGRVTPLHAPTEYDITGREQ